MNEPSVSGNRGKFALITNASTDVLLAISCLGVTAGMPYSLLVLLGCAPLFFLNLIITGVAQTKPRTQPDLMGLAWGFFIPQALFWAFLLAMNLR